MNKDVLMMRSIDQIVLHSKALDLLRDPKLSYLQAYTKIQQMMNDYELDAQDYYENENFEEEMSNCDQEHIDADNRERAADMNAVNKGGY